MAEVDCVLTPSMPRPVTLAELDADPVGPNSLLGYYTNFMNLLDYAAVAIPTAFMKNGLPWGVTVFGRAFTDQYLLGVADTVQRAFALPVVGGGTLDLQAPAAEARHDRARLVVCGAHLDGLPLNGQLRSRGARLVAATTTAPRYRLHALAAVDGTPRRPGLERVAQRGNAIQVEVWELPSAELGSFLTGIPAPLAIGQVELADGRWETGFVCEAVALDGASDISRFGGWRAWLDQA